MRFFLFNRINRLALLSLMSSFQETIAIFFCLMIHCQIDRFLFLLLEKKILLKFDDFSFVLGFVIYVRLIRLIIAQKCFISYSLSFCFLAWVYYFFFNKFNCIILTKFYILKYQLLNVKVVYAKIIKFRRLLIKVGIINDLQRKKWKLWILICIIFTDSTVFS